MQTMQQMIPFNMALLAIAGIFYAWRDLYVPLRARTSPPEECHASPSTV